MLTSILSNFKSNASNIESRLTLLNYSSSTNRSDNTNHESYFYSYHPRQTEDGDYLTEDLDHIEEQIALLLNALELFANKNNYKITKFHSYGDTKITQASSTSLIIQGLGFHLTLITADLSLTLTITGWEV